MSSAKRSKLICAIVKKGQAANIVRAARSEGARGGAVIYGRGTAERQIYETILGLEYEPEKELIPIGVEEQNLTAVLASVTWAGELDKPGRGIGFVLDLRKVLGLAHPVHVR